MAKKVVYDWDWVDQQIDSIGEKLESIEWPVGIKPEFVECLIFSILEAVLAQFYFQNQSPRANKNEQCAQPLILVTSNNNCFS